MEYPHLHIEILEVMRMMWSKKVAVMCMMWIHIVEFSHVHIYTSDNSLSTPLFLCFCLLCLAYHDLLVRLIMTYIPSAISVLVSYLKTTLSQRHRFIACNCKYGILRLSSNRLQMGEVNRSCILRLLFDCHLRPDCQTSDFCGS